MFRCIFRQEVASDVISGENVGQVGLDVPVKFDDYNSNGSRDIHQRIRRMGHFRPFFNFDNCQPEVVTDVISGVVVGPMGVTARAKFDDSRSNRSRDIRLLHFVRSTPVIT